MTVQDFSNINYIQNYVWKHLKTWFVVRNDIRVMSHVVLRTLYILFVKCNMQFSYTPIHKNVDMGMVYQMVHPKVVNWMYESLGQISDYFT